MYGSLGMDIKHVCVLVFFGYYYVRCIVFVWHDYDCDLSSLAIITFAALCLCGMSMIVIFIGLFGRP